MPCGTATLAKCKRRIKNGTSGGLIIDTARNPVREQFVIYSFVKIWNPA
jgi:hypothetical protein